MRTILLPAALVMLLAGACGGTGQSPGAKTDWAGARALTAREDAPRGVATDGARVLFTTGHTQVGENALRKARVDGDTSRPLAVTPGMIPNGPVALDGGTIAEPAATLRRHRWGRPPAALHPR